MLGKAINEEKIAHKENFDQKRVKFISFISFLMGFAQAFVLYVMSTYFKLASGSENLGPFYFLAYAVILVFLFNLHKIIKNMGKVNVFHFALLIKIIVLFLLSIVPPSKWSIILLIFYIISGNLEWVSLDVILESFSLDNMSGRIRGKYLTFINAGYLLGPFFSTNVLNDFGYGGVFSTLLIFNAFIFVFSLVGLHGVNHRFERTITVREIFQKVIRRRNVLRIYYLSFALEFFYALTVIYVPLYLTDLGFSWDRIGLILTAMLLPFVFIQYPMGVLADKKLGEKEMLIVSLVIMAASSSVLYFISTTSILIWSLALFATRVGAAILEVMRDSYFYKRIDGNDVDLINFFRTAMPAAFITSSLITLPLLIFFPIKTTFLVVTAVVFSALFPAFFLVDNKCEKEISKERL